MRSNKSPLKIEIAASQNIEEKNYWLNTLAGDPAKSCFPYDYNRVSAGANRTDTVTAALPAGLCSRLLGLSGGADVRLFITMVTGLAILLSKYTHHHDIMIGAPIYRQDTDADFINTALPLRIRVEDNITFKELLMQTGKVLQEANRCQNYPIEKLPRLLNMVPSDTDDFPLFDVAVLLENLHDKEYLREIPLSMVFIFNRSVESIDVSVEYNSLRYKQKTVERIVAHFINLANHAVADVNVPVPGIDILSEQEKEEILFAFNDTKAGYGRDKTMHQLFQEQADQTPGHIAVTYDGESLTYGRLNEITDRLALELRKRGLRPNRFAVVIMDRSLEMVVAVMAILKAGGAYVPLETYLPEARTIACLDALKSEWVLTQRSQFDKIAKIKEELAELKHVLCLDGENEASEKKSMGRLEQGPTVTSEDIAYVIFTSGTTGTPKGVVVKHKPVINLIEWVNKTFAVGGSDRLLFVVSLSFDLSVYDIFGILASGGSIRVAGSDDVKSPERLLRIIIEEGITFWDSAPAALQLLVPSLQYLPGTAGYTGETRLRLVFLSGDWIPVTMPGILKKVFKGVEVIGLGGATEAVIWSNYYPIGDVDPDWLSIPYGKPIQNARYYILDRFLQPCPTGVAGDLYIGGECLASGYINDDALTAEKFKDNPFTPGDGEKMYKTGDLARWFPDGNMEFLGRQDNQVKIRGFRIELGEIESQLLKHNDIKEAVAIAWGEAREDKYLCAYYVSDQVLDPADLNRYLSGSLPAYMVPPYFVKIAQMPLTPNGKVDRKRLPPPPPPDAPREYTAPRDQREEEMAAIWAEVLKIEKERIGIDENFFELGGHSLKAANLAALIHERMNAPVSLADIFKAPTIRELSGCITRLAKDGDRFTAIEAVEEKEYYEASSAQKRLYFIQKREPESTVYNIPGILELKEKQDLKKVQQALEKSIRRHKILQTSFRMIAGQVVQRIHEDVEFESEYFSTAQALKSFFRPFDLSRAPLFRAGLLKRDEGKHFLVIDMHHIITDGVSVEILLAEFTALYNGAELPALTIQYRDFTEWQTRFARSEKKKRQLEYWDNTLAGGVPALHLPTDYPRPPIQSFTAGEFVFVIGKDFRDKIRALEMQSGATLFMILLAAFNVLLMKYTGEEDIPVGSPVAGRPHADLLHVVGMFVNLLVLRNRPEGEKTFLEFLREVNKNCLQAFENQDVQFEELVDRLTVKKDPSRNPLFDVCFFLQNFSEAQGTIREKSWDHVDIKKFIQFDMELGAFEKTDGIHFTLGYSTALFKESTVEKFAGRYIAILEQVMSNTAVQLKNITVTTRLQALRSNILEHEQGDFGI